MKWSNDENFLRARLGPSPMQLEVLDASEEDYQSCGGADAVRLLQHQGVEP